MCGIAGYFSWTGRPLPAGRIESMTQTLNHRGPDDRGVMQRGGVALGHARLSIIDLSRSGHQPMSNEDDKIWLTFNGEIYNYEQLRQELKIKGHVFKSDTDTEVIIHQYEEDGDSCVEKLNGMFSFSIFDERQDRLLLARDRAGEKPLFYYIGDDFIVYGSEIKALLEAKVFEAKIDSQALRTCLAYNAMAAPQSIISGIKQLLPGQSLSVEKGKIEISRYWDLKDTLKRKKEERSDKDWLAEFSERFDESVRIRMRSDAPYGAFLSGGLDSSAVVMAMTRANKDRPKTYAFGFREESFDEVPYANTVAQCFNSIHKNIYADSMDLPALVEKCIWHGEEYTPNPCFIPVYLLCKGASSDVKMVLSGDGADELFGGYETHQASLFARHYQRCPSRVRAAMRYMAALLPPSEGKVPLETKLKRFTYGAESGFPDCHSLWRYIFRPDEISSVLSRELKCLDDGYSPTQLYRNALAIEDGLSPLDQILYGDFSYYMPNDALVKLDRMGMANSIEIRSPFLDHSLVEFAFGMPTHLKINKFITKKYSIRKYLRGHVPDEIIDRKKAGFNVPVDQWLRKELREYMTDTLQSDTIIRNGIFAPRTVARLIQEHLKGEANNGLQLWNLMCFTKWQEMFSIYKVA